MGTGRNKKALRSHTIGTKGNPSAVPPAFLRTAQALNAPITAGKPSVSPQPLPGEPSDTLQGGFQPVTASLC